MRFLIDANLPRSLVGAIRQLGHGVEFARDIGLASAPDEAIFARARDSGAAIVTRDLDFADIRLYPPEQYAGIVVIRVSDDLQAAEIVRVAISFFQTSTFIDNLPGRLAIVEPDRVRIRPALA